MGDILQFTLSQKHFAACAHVSVCVYVCVCVYMYVTKSEMGNINYIVMCSYFDSAESPRQLQFEMLFFFKPTCRKFGKNESSTEGLIIRLESGERVEKKE